MTEKRCLVAANFIICVELTPCIYQTLSRSWPLCPDQKKGNFFTIFFVITEYFLSAVVEHVHHFSSERFLFQGGHSPVWDIKKLQFHPNKEAIRRWIPFYIFRSVCAEKLQTTCPTCVKFFFFRAKEKVVQAFSFIFWCIPQTLRQ